MNLRNSSHPDDTDTVDVLPFISVSVATFNSARSPDIVPTETHTTQYVLRLSKHTVQYYWSALASCVIDSNFCFTHNMTSKIHSTAFHCVIESRLFRPIGCAYTFAVLDEFQQCLYGSNCL